MKQSVESAKTAPKRVTILGCTGSVGCNTLDIIGRDPDAYAVVALTAYQNVDLLVEQARHFKPELVVIGDPGGFEVLSEALSGSGVEVAAGREALAEAAGRQADWVMAAIVGAAGLQPTLNAVRAGAVVALANKESLVCAGSLLTREVEAAGATLLPVDSEHNAIYQVFDFERPEAVEKIILTASGGPFRTFSRDEMTDVRPEQAVKHPIWNMGAKISVDSATLMNKGLELIEAYYLFPLQPDCIEILVHPQSVIHSMVAYKDGSVLAQMGSPDMRTPIAYTLAWPDRMSAPAARLDLVEVGQLTFEAPDTERFPALALARQALQSGGSAPTILNAANEVAVQGFLEGKIGFLDIAAVVEQTLQKIEGGPIESLLHVEDADQRSRREADAIITRIAK